MGFGVSTCNSRLSHFFSYLDPVTWPRYRIKTVGAVVGNGMLLTFGELKSRYRLPNSHLLRFLQFRHAFSAQFGSSTLEVPVGDLESLLRAKDLPKALSIIYKELFTDTITVLASCHAAWLSDFPQLDNDDWDDAWIASFARLVSAHDHLIQFMFLHRIYYTPAKLARIFPAHSSNCWRCDAPAHFLELPAHPAVLGGDGGQCWVGHDNRYKTVYRVLSVRPGRYIGTHAGNSHFAHPAPVLCTQNYNFVLEEDDGPHHNALEGIDK